MTSPPFRFTIFDLDSCLAVAKAVDAGGGVLSSAALADRLGYKSDVNGSFRTRLANARLFGLLGGTSAVIEVSPRATSILHPDYPATAARARLEAFEDVPLYKAVLDYYHGRPLPDDAGLRNALTTRWNIHPDKSAVVLSRLIESAEQAGLFSTAGDRSKMIRPSFGSTPAAVEPESIAVVGVGGAASSVASTIAATSGSAPGARDSKIIDGVLDMLPNEEWDEQSLQLWL